MRSGSSPLTRGKPRELSIEEVAQGLIPAHAGKTPSPLPASQFGPAHPRSRGENFVGGLCAVCASGSSPLTRGKRRRPHTHPQRRRLIPAHAGKTSSTGSHGALRWAHPRSRGENALSPRFPMSTPGSSPLTRGKQDNDHPDRPPRGLIPAHAGKTSTYSHTRAHPRAHPRSRGENQRGQTRDARPPGSSPLTRGKPLTAIVPRGTTGLIPAHAGKTRSAAAPLARRRAHPRSRGENMPGTQGSATLTGSSPLTRGKRW